MDEESQEIKELQQINKKELIRGNLFMLLFFILLAYFFESGKLVIITWVLLACLLLAGLSSLYSLITGKLIATKSSRRIQEFDRKQWGEKRWRRNKIAEVVLFTVLGVGLAFLVFTSNISYLNLNSTSSYFPFIGAWIGYNVSGIKRMNTLKEQPANG